jgi:hypothetical protein
MEPKTDVRCLSRRGLDDVWRAQYQRQLLREKIDVGVIDIRPGRIT